MGWRLSAVGITRPPELRTGPPWDRDRRHPGTWWDRGRGLLVQDQEFLRVDAVTRFEISDMAAEVTRRVLERRLMIECSRSDSGQTPVHMLSRVSSGARIHSRRRVESSGWLRHARKGEPVRIEPWERFGGAEAPPLDAGVPLVPARTASRFCRERSDLRAYDGWMCSSIELRSALERRDDGHRANMSDDCSWIFIGCNLTHGVPSPTNG